MSDTRLYTWFDVQDMFEVARAKPDWPRSIAKVRVYDDMVELLVKPSTDHNVIASTLNQLFGLRFDQQSMFIILESPSGSDTPNRLPVEVEVDDVDEEEASDEDEDEVSQKVVKGPHERPTFSRVSVLTEESRLLPPSLPPASPLIISFFSFKGGVGRTLHLISLMKALCERSKEGRPKLLVIDADLEAPGLTWFARQKEVPAEVSLLDYMALAHYDADPTFSRTVTLVAQRVRQQPLTLSTEVGDVNVFFLPTFRSEEQIFRMPIRPEHLIQRSGREWVMGDLFARLGKELGVDAVLVDLRAGVSELSGPILFDPRILRVLVTTTSKQSVEGTKLVLHQMHKVSPKPQPEGGIHYYDPALLISMVPEELAQTLVPQVAQRLRESYPNYPKDNPLSQRLRVEQSLFAQQLLYIEDLDTALRKIGGTPVHKLMERLADEWLPSEQDAPTLSQVQLTKLRKALARVTSGLLAEDAALHFDFMRIAAHKAITARFQFEPPVAVMRGASGAGKTFTCLQILRREYWSNFLIDSGIASPEPWGVVWPLISPLSAGGEVRSFVEQSRQRAAKILSLSGDLPNGQDFFSQVREMVSSGMQLESEWVTFWLRLIGQSIGIPVPAQTAPASHIQASLEAINQRVVIVVDGLEDVLGDSRENDVSRMALKTLTQDVLQLLREIPDRRLGLIVFVRTDLHAMTVTASTKTGYRPFELKWRLSDALRLTAWVSRHTGLSEFINLDQDLEDSSRESLQKALAPLWGLRLERGSSSEPYTDVSLAILFSNFRGEIQAREMVQMLSFAATAASSTPEYANRVLQPDAIRVACIGAGLKSLERFGREIAHFQDIVKKITSVPFRPSEVGMSAAEAQLLRDFGIAAEIEGKMYVPLVYAYPLQVDVADEGFASLGQLFLRESDLGQ